MGDPRPAPPWSAALVVDRALAQHLLASGRSAREPLAWCLAEQQRRGGAERVRLVELLLGRGLVSPAEAAALASAASPAPTGPAPATVPTQGEGGVWHSAVASAESNRALEALLSPEELAALHDPAKRVGRYVVVKELGRARSSSTGRCPSPGSSAR